MSLFRYKITVAGGREKEGLITAKSEAAARERVAKENKVVDWLALGIETPTSKSPKPAPKPKPLTKLGKMLYLQRGLCFFCRQPLREEDASIEHLNPISKGGARTSDNEVVCHKSLNATFGDIDLKEKFKLTLDKAGNFKCPP